MLSSHPHAVAEDSGLFEVMGIVCENADMSIVHSVGVRRMQNSASCLDNSLRFFPSFSLQKLSWLSRISGVGLREWVHFLPRLLAFLMEVTFLSTDTCLF